MNTRRVTVLSILLAAALAVPISAGAATTKPDVDRSITGSGSKYLTEVSRKTTGDLTNADLREVSLLTGQVLNHVSTAIEKLEARNTADARLELKNAQTLIGIVRDMLPVTEVTTIVRNVKGTEMYRHTEVVQDDLIELYDEVAVVDVLNNILNAKKATEAEPEYLGSVELYTSVLADLGYIERKVEAASKAMDRPEEALKQLRLAEVDGVDMRISEAESPLLEARRALELAEVQVMNGSFDMARDNLNRARARLKEYEAVHGVTKEASVQEITDQIDTLNKDLKKQGVAEEIRDLWNKTVRLFEHHNPNMAQSTQTSAAK
jgi:hypothetical protein